jgi:hypothetical protein
MKELTDTDLMPWGKYKGQPMQDVPASYLHWFWTQPNGGKTHKEGNDPVADYIRANIVALKTEYPDGIWT